MINLLKHLNITTILGIVCIALMSFVYVQRSKINNLENTVAVYEDFTENLREGQKFYKNTNGNLVAQVHALTATNRDFKDILGTKLNYLTDNFDGVKRDLRNVNGVLTTAVNASRTFELPTVDTTYIMNSDTVSAWAFKTKDPFFSLEGLVIPDIEFRRVIATPNLTADFYGVLIEKRGQPKRRFLGIGIGRKTEKFELTTTNPYISIDSLSFIKRK